MIWTQWNDLAIPAGLEHLPSNGIHPAPEQLEKITFYVPLYMGGKAAIEQIPLMKNLQVVQSPNAGFDDVLQVLPQGVTLCNASGVHDASTAELAVGLTIAARRGFAAFASNKEKGTWVHTRNTALADSRVGIVGYGNIGALIAKQLSNFSVEVIPFTRSGANGSQKMSEFDSLLPTLDVIILIVPLTDQTRHLMNAQRLSSMKVGATLINVARGAVVDTDALVSQLHTGRITAGLDVTDPEPLPSGHALWSAPNVIISPHVGGDTTAFEPRGRALVEAQLKRFAEGSPLINCVAGPTR